MNNIINQLTHLFNMDPSDLTIESDKITWSYEVDPSVIDSMYQTLYSLEPYFNSKGYDLMMQEDPEFFGGCLTKR